MRLIYFIIIANAFLFAKDGVIKGKVTDSLNGSALIGANVVVEGTNLGAATDAGGEYIIKQLDPGTYTIMVSYIGYQSYKETINLNRGQKLSKDLALKPEAIEMETYVVTASRRRERVEDAPAAISVGPTAPVLIRLAVITLSPKTVLALIAPAATNPVFTLVRDILFPYYYLYVILLFLD